MWLNSEFDFGWCKEDIANKYNNFLYELTISFVRQNYLDREKFADALQNVFGWTWELGARDNAVAASEESLDICEGLQG